MINEPEKISVIIPIYNVDKYLNKCIQSVVDQTYKNLEIILVDDGSLDQCRKICDEWAKKDDRILVIHKQHGGVSDARNVGLDVASGEYIAFVDSDDFIQSDMLEKAYTENVKNNTDMVIFGFEFEDENGSFIKSWKPEKDGIINQFEALMMMADEQAITPCVWNKMYCRSLWEGIRFPVGKLCEDAYIMHKILWQCQHVLLIQDELYHYVQRENSLTRSKATIRSLDNIEEIYERILFYEQHGLQQAFMDKRNPIVDKYFWIKKDIQIQTKEERKRFHEAKRMVRYYIKKYGKHIRKAEIFHFEAPRLFYFLQHIRDRLFCR